jgi:2,4-dienoyl-CoA reductase-like NADH-dependent reductase (Old Yellow Enzyme family)
VPNRLVMTPHLGRLSQGRFLAYLEARVRRGFGLIITPAGSPVYGASMYDEAVNFVPDGYQADNDATVPVPPSPAGMRNWQPMAAFLARQAEIVHAGGAVIVGQIHHPGAERSWDSFQPSVAPSALDGEWPVQHPHELTDGEIEKLVAAYVVNAQLIVAAGLDGVEVHAAHGYLLNRFLSPAYNHRDGAFGGSVERRWAILGAVLRGIRDAIGPAPVLGVRLPAFEQVSGGLSTDEIAAGLAPYLERLNYLNISVGNHDGLADGRPALAYTSPWLVERPTLLPAGAALRRSTGMPVIVTGGIVSAAAVQAALAAGSADLVGVARAAIADPEFAVKVIDARVDEIVECIGCNECVLVPFSCPVNPAAGREAELTRPGAPVRRRFVVVGGGPAGLSAGLALSSRGHDVHLFDRRAALGGLLGDLVRDPARRRWRSMLDRQVTQALAELRVSLGESFDAGHIAALAPDAVIVATGAQLVPPSYATDGSVEVLTSEQILIGARPAAAGQVVVVGGTEPHLDPLLTARLLAAEGHRVALLTDLVSIGPALEPRTRNALLAMLAVLRVTMHCSSRVTAIADGELTIDNLFADTTTITPAACVVLAHSRRSDQAVAALTRAAGVETFVIGDALAPRRLTHSVLEGTRFGLSL